MAAVNLIGLTSTKKGKRNPVIHVFFECLLIDGGFQKRTPKSIKLRLGGVPLNVLSMRVHDVHGLIIL